MQPEANVPPKVPAPITAGPAKRQLSLGTAIAIALVCTVAAFIGGLRLADALKTFAGTQSGGLDFSTVQEVYNKLQAEFDGPLDAKQLIEGAKKGMVEAAGDPYTVYFTEEEAEQFLSDLNGTFSGIGAELGKKESGLIIVTTLDDSPARRSGLLANDAIVKVNDQETTGWSIDKAVSQIRGEKGTTVKLTILRGQEVKEFSIVRDDIINPSVKYEITADNIGYLRISRFSDTDTKRLATEAAQLFKTKNVKGVVLDVRGNGGGYLDTAQDIAGLWLKDKVVVQERRGEEVIDTLKTNGSAILEGVPTVVLIDGGSASASEIVAGALHDHKAAQLVGVKSFGKGSVQQIAGVGTGQLKVTVAKWYTPAGKNISKEGIAPDIEVVMSDADILADRDTQRDKAVELLK